MKKVMKIRRKRWKRSYPRT